MLQVIRPTSRFQPTAPAAPSANPLMLPVRLIRPPGLVSFARGLQLQAEALERARSEEGGNTLIVLEHEPVYTAGRQSARELFSAPTGAASGDAGRWVRPLPAPMVAADRGGKVTFHGPGQLVMYPILDLRRFQVELARQQGQRSCIARPRRCRPV